MKEHFFLAVDCGATSGRVVLASLGADSFSMEEIYRFPNQLMERNGRYYWDIQAISEHLRQGLGEASRRKCPVTSIGIDTWGVDFGAVDAEGRLASPPRAYRDPYTQGIPEQLFARVPAAELYAVTGIQTMDFNTIFQLYAQRQERDVSLENATNLLFMPDLLAYMLTGERVCEYTIASTSGMMDQRHRCMDRSLMERLGFNGDWFPPIIQPGTEIGVLRPDWARQTGLGSLPVVAVAGHDTASAVVAVPAENERFAYLSSGTWSLMGIETETAIINRRSEQLNFTNEGGIEGTTRFLKNITGMWLLEQCRKAWSREGRDYSYPDLVAMAASAAGYQGRIRPDDVRFANPEQMEREIRSALSAAGYPAPQNDAEVVSCIYHSLADRYREVLRMLQSFAPFPIGKLHVIGGGAANDLMSQWTADAIGMSVVSGPVEATAIGNVMVQAKAAGLLRDRWEMRRLIAATSQVKTFHPQAKDSSIASPHPPSTTCLQ